jgi:hypothetical protein
MGADLALSRSPPTWDAAQRLINAARPKLEQDAKLLKELLDQSRKLLDPLEDPFDLDFDLHRWLAIDREEAYSDWLAWVVRQAKTAERVFTLFGRELPPGLPASQEARVDREVWVLMDTPSTKAVWTSSFIFIRTPSS